MGRVGRGSRPAALPPAWRWLSVGQPRVPGRGEPGAPDEDRDPRARQWDPEPGVTEVRDDDYRCQADGHDQLRQQELEVDAVELGRQGVTPSDCMASASASTMTSVPQ